MADQVSIFVSPIVKMLITDAAAFINQKFHLLLGVEDEIKKLSTKLTTIQFVLEDAEEKQLGSKPLRNWLQKLEDAASDAEDILETFATEASLWQQKQQVKKLWTKLKSAQEIEKLLARLDEIAKEKDQFSLNVRVNAVTKFDDDRNTSFLVSEHVFGREHDINTIVDMLLSEKFNREDNNITVIPIIGMGGLGKTTLAQLVYNDDRVFKKDRAENPFEFRMWVCVTDNFDHRRILKEMIEYHSEMKYDINKLSDSQLHSRLLDILARKRFLLVLDDVWTERYEDWEKLQNLLKHGGRGSRVLVTSRTTRVSEVMGTESPYLLGYLPEDQCWSLFRKIAFKECNLVHRDLDNIGMEIVRKCKGLPLAVKAMGGLLRGNSDINKWRKILKHDIWEAEEVSTVTGKQTVLPALKLSYDHLPHHLKICFAYCYIFPKAYVFNKIELVKLWKAASLIQSRGRDTIDEIGSAYFDDMLTRSFFHHDENDKEGMNYRMHDLIHDLAQSVSSNQCYQVKDNKPCRIPERSRHISLLCKEVEEPIREVIDKSKKLRTLISPTGNLKDFGQALDKLFHSLKYIRVLDLSSSTILELPESVGELKLLHYLDLSKTEIRMLPNSICGLYNLQTLKLLGCRWLFELPKDLGKLVNLHHLELDDMFWHKVYKLPPRMGSITGLQNMHAFQVSDEKGYGIVELRDMMYLTGTLHISNLESAVNAGEAKLKDKERLEKVVFEWSKSSEDGCSIDEAILEDLQPHSNLKELGVFRFRGTIFPSWLRHGLVQNLVTISLNHCTKCKVLSLGQLPHLEKLYIKGLLELEEWANAQYSSLFRLKISNCPKLTELPYLFPNLRVLKIKKCDSLKALPRTPSLKFLILADNVVLENWNDLIPAQNVSTGQCFAFHTFINVLELQIKNCPEIRAVPEVFAPQKLEISGCPLLSTLPIPHRAQRLQRLALDACPDGTLVRAIPDTSSLFSLVISRISSLESLGSWPHLPGLKALYIHQCQDLVSLVEEEKSFQGLDSLTLLSIRDCPKLVTLPTTGLPTSLTCLIIGSCDGLKFLGPKEVLKNLTSLKDLYIENCTLLQSLPEDGLPTSLQHLRIEGCPLLKKQCQKETGPDWPKIENIPDLEFDSVEISSTPSLPMKTENPKIKASSTAWYHKFTPDRGNVLREIGQPQQLNPPSRMQKDNRKHKGQTSKANMEP